MNLSDENITREVCKHFNPVDLCIKCVSELAIKQVIAQREEILKAFIAETGLLPSECEQVYRGDRWWVQKRCDK